MLFKGEILNSPPITSLSVDVFKSNKSWTFQSVKSNKFYPYTTSFIWFIRYSSILDFTERYLYQT